MTVFTLASVGLGVLSGPVLLFLAGLGFALFLGNIIKGVAESWEYSTDTDSPTDPGSVTWTNLPLLQLMQNGFQKFSEEAQLVQTINALEASAAKKGIGIIPVAYRDDDTFLATLESAEANHTPVWFRVKPKGRDYRIIGGDTGCLVYVNRDPMPEFGDLVNALVGFSATGADPGDTYTTQAAGSGS